MTGKAEDRLVARNFETGTSSGFSTTAEGRIVVLVKRGLRYGGTPD